jgi:hypothetical protein
VPNAGASAVAIYEGCGVPGACLLLIDFFSETAEALTSQAGTSYTLAATSFDASELGPNTVHLTLGCAWRCDGNSCGDNGCGGVRSEGRAGYAAALADPGLYDKLARCGDSCAFDIGCAKTCIENATGTGEPCL